MRITHLDVRKLKRRVVYIPEKGGMPRGRKGSTRRAPGRRERTRARVRMDLGLDATDEKNYKE